MVFIYMCIYPPPFLLCVQLLVLLVVYNTLRES